MCKLSVKPLGISQLSWDNLDETFKELLGCSAYHNLPISPDKQSALLHVLGQGTKEPIRDSQSTGQHLHASFIGSSDSETLVDLHRLGLKVFTVPAKRDSHLFILSGTITEITNAIIIGCHSDSSYGIRFLCNGIISYLERAGFRELWSEYHKTRAEKETFILEPR